MLGVFSTCFLAAAICLSRSQPSCDCFQSPGPYCAEKTLEITSKFCSINCLVSFWVRGWPEGKVLTETALPPRPMALSKMRPNAEPASALGPEKALRRFSKEALDWALA